MGNSLKADLRGKVVVLKADFMKPEFQDLKYRLFRVKDGFGAVPFTSGTALIGEHLVNGVGARYSSYDVERLATEEEIKQNEKPNS